MSTAYYVIPNEVPKLLPFNNKTVEDVLDYIDVTDFEDHAVIPIAPGILIWINTAIIQAQHNIAFKIDSDDSLVFGKAIFTGLMEKGGNVVGLSGKQVTSIPDLVMFPSL
ncbi:hypothetical protein [Salinicoccus sp. CNSTN-B1]